MDNVPAPTGGGNAVPKVDGETGTAIVETALILGILFLLLFGIMEFATLFFTRAVIINASREGGRLGARLMSTWKTTLPTRPLLMARLLRRSWVTRGTT